MSLMLVLCGERSEMIFILYVVLLSFSYGAFRLTLTIGEDAGSYRPNHP